MIKSIPTLESLSAPFEAALDGVIVIDDADRIIYANPAACEITGARLDELLGRDALEYMPSHERAAFAQLAASKQPGSMLRGSMTLVRSSGEDLHVEYTSAPFVVDGRWQVVIMFRDVTETRQMARKLEALSQIASRTAFAESLEETLAKLAQNVVQATDTVAAGVCLLDEHLRDFRVFGSYGLPAGADAKSRWQAAIERGARMPNTDSAREMRPLLHVNARQELLNDPRYEPICSYLRDAAWDTVASVPLIHRNRAIGVLNVFYPRGRQPGDREIAFLAAIADHAAVIAESARLFADAREKAVLEERQRLARELHDSVSQALYGIALGARTARTLVDREPAQAIEPLDYVLSLAEAALAEMRALIFELRPETLESEGLVAALTKQIASARARHGLDVRAHMTSEPALPYEAKEALYRIAQEALNNVVKHARARRVDLRLSTGMEEVVLEVRDDGVGFVAEGAVPGHLGLQSMRERAVRVGGTLDVESAPTRGTRIRARISAAASAARGGAAHLNSVSVSGSPAQQT